MAIRSLRSRCVAGAWGLLAVANFLAPRYVGELHTVPFQLSWAGITLLYLSRSRGLASLVAMSLVTAGELAWTAMNEEPGTARLSELPLMVGLFVAVVWIGARRQARADAMRARADSEREFLRDTSHALRTPITIARGHAELLRDAAPTDEIAEDANVLLQELDHLTRLSDRLLVLAAADTPGFLWLEAVEVEQLVVETARRWSAAADRRWVIDVGVEGVLTADRERVSTALDALIENALKFTDPGDTIRIFGGGEGSRAVLVVDDTGEGIPEPDLARIFERFVRGSARRRSGTGLGLAIVRAIVDAHGGSVGVTSAAGSGTQVRLVLPRFAPSAAARNDGPMTIRPPSYEAPAA